MSPLMSTRRSFWFTATILLGLLGYAGLSAGPQEKPQVTPEAQTAQGPEPISDIELALKDRAQAVLDEGHIIQDQNDWRLSTRTIASIMINGADGQKFKGWGDETLRAILDGRHIPSDRLGLKRLVKK